MPSKRPSNRNKSHVVSIRLRGEQLKRLRRFSRQLSGTPSEAAALLVEEGLRRCEFAFVDFRNSAGGRQAYIQGSRVTVWQVVMIARAYSMDAQKTAGHLQCSESRVQAALNYYASFPDEIEEALEDNARFDFGKLQQMLPQIQAFTVAGPGRAVAEQNAPEYNNLQTDSASRTGRAKADKKHPGKT